MDTSETIQEIVGGLEQVGIHVPWRTNAPDYMGSERDSATTGDTGFDIAGFKEWEPGERIDTRTTARSGWRQKFTRVLEQPREVTVFVIVEESASVKYGMVNQTKKELSARLLASVLLNAAAYSDFAGYAIWSGMDLLQFRRAQPAGRIVTRALEAYLDPDMEPDGNDREEQTGLGIALSRLPMDRKCLVFVISDCQSRSPADQFALEQASAMHDVVFLVVGDLRERELPQEGFGFRDIEDIESGTTISVFLSKETREAWRQDFDRRRKELGDALIPLGIAVEEFFTSETLEQLNDKMIPILQGFRPDAISEVTK
jgi:uncharacterized protein (DUF58 family)